MAVERGSGTIAVGAPVAGVTARGLDFARPYEPPVVNTAEPPPMSLEEQALRFLNDPRELEMASAAQANGSQYSEIASDFRNLPFISLVEKYGETAARQRINLVDSDRLFNDNFQTERNLGQQTGDAVLGAAAGFTNITGSGISAVIGGAGYVDRLFNEENTGLSEYAADYAENTGVAAEFIRSFQSDELRNRRDAERLKDVFDAQSRDAAYEQDIQDGRSKFSAGLRDIGRGVADTAETMWNDPALAADIVAEGIGSLGPSARLAAGAQRAVAGRAEAAILAQAINPTFNGALRVGAERLLQRSAVPLAVGASEASGAYQNAVAQVMQMSEAELAQNSEAYLQMRQEGIDHESAVRTIASDAGLLAFAVQLPVAALAGIGVAKFEAAPLARGSFSDALRTIGSQTIEEAYQGATGEISAGIGVQTVAGGQDRLTENVGSALVQGAVGGLGMAGVLAAPGVAAETARLGAQTTADVYRARMAAVDRRTDESSPVGNRATQARIGEVEMSIIKIAESMPGSGIETVIKMTPEEIDSLPEAVREVGLADETNPDPLPNSRMSTIQRVVSAVADGKLDDVQSQEAALYAYMEMQKIQGFALNEMPAEIKSLPESDPTRVAYETAQTEMGKITQNEKFQKVIERAESTEQAGIEDDTYVVPELNQSIVNETIAVALANPAGVNTKLVDAILKGRDEALSNQQSAATDNTDLPTWQISFTDEIYKSLQAAKSIAETRKENLQQKQAVEAERVSLINIANPTAPKIVERRPQDIVKDEIHIDGKKVGKDKSRVLPSLNDYQRDIIASASKGGIEVRNRNGDITTAKDSIAGLKDFARHMANKIDAFNRSFADGKGKESKMSFDTKTPSGWVKAGRKGSSSVYADPNNPNSMFLAREAYADAVSAAKLHNDLVDLYPELGTEKVVVPDLAPQMASRNLRELANASVAPATNEGNPLSQEPVTPPVTAPVVTTPVADATPSADTTQAKPKVEPKPKEETKSELQEFFDENPKYSLSELSQEEKQAVSEAVTTQMGDLGFEANLANDIVRNIVGIDNTEASGRAFYKRRVMAIHVDLVKQTGRKLLKKVITHELMHLIDNAARGSGKFLVSDNSRLQVGGDIHNEVLAAIEANDVLKGYFKYAMSYNNKVASTQSAELFAEIGTLYVHRPDLVKEHLPNAAIFIEATIRKAGGVPTAIGVGTGSDQSTSQEGTDATGDGDRSLRGETDGQLAEGVLTNDDGDPIVFYHGTRGVFDQFNEGEVFWTTRKGVAKEFALRAAGSEETPARVIEANLEIKKPYIMDAGAETELTVFSQQNSIEWKGAIASGEFDGVLIFNDQNEALAISTTNEQIKQIVEKEEETVTEIALPDSLMKDKKGRGRFTTAYAIQKGKSLLSTLAEPLNRMVEAFNSIKTVNDITRGSLDYTVTANQRLAFQKMLREDVPALVQKMNDRLNSINFQDGDGLLETLKKGELDVPSLRRGKVSTLINEATGTYDQRLIEQAAMAALHWALTNSVRPDRVPTHEKAAEIFHVEEDQVTPEMIAALTFGMSQTDAKENLGRMIEDFWGVKRSNVASISDTRGISESIAAELLTVMEGQYLKTSTFDVFKGVYNPNTNQTKTIKVKHMSVSMKVESFENLVESLGTMKTILGDMVLGEEGKTRFIGKPPSRVSKTQKRNPFSKISEKETRVIETAQKIEFRRNGSFINLMNAIGKDAFVEILGTVKIVDGKINKVDRKSVEGKNLSNELSWQGVMDHDAAVNSYAELNNLDPNKVPTFYDWYITKVGRLHMAGFGPQADKTAREAFISTISTLDMTNEADIDFFWMTVAQSSGLVKVEREKRAEAVASAQALMDETYGNSIMIMQEWLSGDTSKALSDVDVAIIKAEMAAGGEGTTKALHAILAVAKLRLAQKAGGEALASFEHMLSLEADGKTDGPINAMMNFISGKFDQTQLDMLAKGGFFMNQRDRTLNQHYETDKADLYQVAAKKLQDLITEMTKDLKANHPKAVPYMEAIQRLSVAYSATAMSFDDDGNLVIGRNILKNPLTVTVYGSGIDGINQKVTGAIIDAIYQNMTKALNDDPTLINYEGMMEDINLLFGSKLYYFNGAYNVNTASTRISWKGDPENYEFTSEARENFNENMKLLFTTPMHSAIDEMMGSTTSTMELFQKTTQIQSVIMMDWFQRRIMERLQEKYISGEIDGRFVVYGKDENGKKMEKDFGSDLGAAQKFVNEASLASNAELGMKGEFLSQKDYDQIFVELSKFGAIVENDEQTLNMGTSENTDSSRVFSSNIEGKVRGEARMPAPSEAGVRAAPYITISRGDALMINNIYAAFDAITKSLPVFDGVELAANEMDTASEKINRSVAEAWSQNAAMDVSDSFSAFLRENPLEGISDKTTLLVMQTLGAKASSQIETELGRLNEKLIQTAQEIQARKDTIASVLFSVDHMAGAESPHTNDGQELTGTPEEIIEKLNDMYQQNLDRIQGKSDRKLIGSKENLGFRKLIKKFGTKNETDDVTEMYAEGFLELMEASQSEMTTDQKKVYDVIKNTMDKDVTFIFGSVEEVTKYRNRVHPENNDGKDVPEGQMDIMNKIVYVTNLEMETALHEMVHATTIGKVAAYYSDRSVLNQKEVDAIERMIELMADFMNRDFRFDGVGLQESASNTKHQINEAMQIENEVIRNAAMLNEFMAWSLTNQELINAAKKTRNRNPLAVIGEKLLRLMGRIIGGDIFSNILFNTEILVERQIEYDDLGASASVVLNHMRRGNQRLTDLMKQFEEKVAHWVREREMADPSSQAEDLHVIQYAKAVDTITVLEAGGFTMNKQERLAFAAIQSAMATTMKMDGLVLQRSQRMYEHVTKQLSPESFMADPASTNPNDRVLAESKYKALTGKLGIEIDDQGNSNLLSSFIAMSQVNDELRNILKDMKLPKSINVNYESTDEFLYSMANSMMETLAITVTKEGRKNTNVSEAMDSLTYALGQIEAETQTEIEKVVNPLLNRGDQAGAKALARVGEAVWQFGDTRIDQNSSALRRGVMNAAKTLGSILSSERGEALARSTTSLMNITNTPLLFKELINDMIGITDDNRAILMMVNLGKKLVSVTRQDFRETLPKVFEKQFTRKPTKEEWSLLHYAMGKTDIAALGIKMSVSELSELFRSNLKVIDAIRDTETKLRDLDKKNFNAYMRKSKQLARYMMEGVAGPNLLRNSEAIGRLLNEDLGVVNPTEEVVQLIDELTSLYAIQNMDRASKDKMADLATEESAGIEFMLHYIHDLRKAELAKGTAYGGNVAKLNGYKGYIPAETQDGMKLVLEDDKKFKQLSRLGYVKRAGYHGPGYKVGADSMSYYFSSVAGRNTYSQGAMQTVQMGVNGVDPANGRSLMGTTGGYITGPAVGAINRKAKNNTTQTGEYEALMPIFDDDGNVVAFERAFHPDVIATLNRNTHLGEMIGAWRGRQAEEELAQTFNETLIDRVKENWDELKAERANEFIDMSSLGPKDDKILLDSWNMIPDNTKAYIESVFGEDGFMVKKDLVNNLLGYRNASVADIFTLNTRMPENVMKVVEDSLRFFMGDKAMRIVVTGERGVQTAISTAKDLIIIKSVLVPALNFTSNILQQMIRGVPVSDIYKGTRTKLVEINSYLKHESRRVELEAIIKASKTKPYEQRKAEIELQSMADADRRMSIWPLIQAGEFSTISEGMTDLDESLTNGTFTDYMETIANRLPGSLKTVGRYALITRDTALYQGMSRAVQYGDFLAKANLYDHRMKAEGLTHEQALARITEEFVNYNLLPGRGRTFAESVGLIWFQHFKIRSMKVALNMMRENPLRAMLTTVGGPIMPVDLGIGSPLQDNLASVTAQGRLGYSLGWDMLWRAPSLNPWLNLID